MYITDEYKLNNNLKLNYYGIYLVTQILDRRGEKCPTRYSS